MGKGQKKTGKGRLDKYYKLAKEQGYRARSAFKLIQLNKKYAFLESARCCIDLCAAPGGWLQVASKYMPVNSLIIGVDLVPIKPIPRVVTFACDITTSKCRNLLRGEMKDWKADVVLHDGAPNVGTAWVQDAYSQSELVLMSLKLAVEFLLKGGTFVTKVFRSADYNNLIWVFNQLFAKVEVTKPPSSRNVSAEIFVICREFLAPQYIDPKFLDPKYVFKDLSTSVSQKSDQLPSRNFHANVFQPEKRTRKRDGYADGDYTLFKAVPVAEFIRSTDPISILGDSNMLSFESDEEKDWACLSITNDDVKANCRDLKVLGRGDFKLLMKWRLALRHEIGLDIKAQEVKDVTEIADVVQDGDEDENIQRELERLAAAAAARLRRARRRANELKTRTIQRMQLQMTTPLDIGLEQQDLSLAGQNDTFVLEDNQHPSHIDDDALDSGTDDVDSSDRQDHDDDAMEVQLEEMYENYQGYLREKDAKFRVKEARRQNGEEEWTGIGREASDDDDDDDDDDEGGWDKREESKYEEDHSSSEDEDDENRPTMTRKRHCCDIAEEHKKRPRLDLPLSAISSGSKTANAWFSQGMFAGLSDTGDTHNTSNPVLLSKIEKAAGEEPEADMWDVQNTSTILTNSNGENRPVLSTAEAVSLAHQLVNREKTKTELVNDGFTRYSLNSKEGLPAWFLDDEQKHYKANIPITKEAVVALRARQRALDARPIKKIAEAKARKKLKITQRLEKAMKKAETVNATTDMTEREKAQQIEKLMKKGQSSQKAKKDIKVVVAKGAHRGIKGRPRGVKGRYLMVDARMRKETRAKKRREKVTKKRK